MIELHLDEVLDDGMLLQMKDHTNHLTQQEYLNNEQETSEVAVRFAL